jgi:predicted nucleotidyltransferase component of viral defense system
MLDIEQIQSFYPEHIRPFKKNLLREYLQYKILEAIFESPLAEKLTLMGGTCIHIIHGSPRFSEVLDFDNPDIDRHDFETLSQKELRDRLLRRCKQLDFSRLTKDLEPFVYSKKELQRVLMFPGFIQQAL